MGDFYDLFADGQYCQDANDLNAFDPNYGTTDSNSVLFLSMTQDTEVVAYFRCGSGLGALPLLTVLGVWLVWRQRR